MASQRLQKLKDHLSDQSSFQTFLKNNNCSLLSSQDEEKTDYTSILKTQKNHLYPYRKDASFDSYQMKRFMEGREYELKRRIFATLSQDPLFQQPILELELNRSDQRELCFKQMKRVHEFGFVSEEELERESWRGLVLTRCLYFFDVSLASKLMLAVGFFLSCLKNLGTERHLKYLEKVRTLQILGCFALTELSHGSNIKSLQTTATFDKSTQEFILHSPNFESYKWWIGVAGKTANHAIVIAKLILNGKDYGLHAFVVPIRSLETHLPLPGVVVGDLGPKLGQNGHENGFIGFDNYRIPRENLLNRVADVREDGTYTAEHIPPMKRFALLLNPLSAGRVGIVGLCLSSLVTAITIGIRYSAARYQFGPDNKEETAIIEYPLQQYRLFPSVASAYCLEFFRQWLISCWDDLDKQLKTDKFDERLLAEMHAISSAAKPLSGWIARDTIQTVRECCGGHGYSASSRLGVLREDADPNLTYEGENNVLIQQTGKYLIDNFQKKIGGKSITTPLKTLQFLNDFEKIMESKCLVQSESDFLNDDTYIKAFKFRVCYLLFQSGLKLQNEVSKQSDLFTAWNNCQVFYIHSAAKAFIELLVIEKTLERIQSIQEMSLKNVLLSLCHLFALSRMEVDLANFRENDYVNSSQTQYLKSAILSLCNLLKKDIVSLVDAMAPPDSILYSSLGASDGYVYKHLWNHAITGKENLERASWWSLIQQGSQPRSRMNEWKY